MAHANEKYEVFINREEMIEAVELGKSARFIDRLEHELDHLHFKYFLNSFDNKLTYEIKPALQLNKKWLQKIFGFKGELYVNIASNGVDAAYIGNGKRATIEFKLFSTLSLKDSESRYKANNKYWCLKSKKWTFSTKPNDFEEDYAIVMIANARDDTIIEAISIPHDKMVNVMEYATRFRKPDYSIRNSPIMIRYLDVKYFDHMNGNDSLYCRNKKIVDDFVARGIIHKSDKGTYRHSSGFIGTTFAVAAKWILESHLLDVKNGRQKHAKMIQRFNSLNQLSFEFE